MIHNPLVPNYLRDQYSDKREGYVAQYSVSHLDQPPGLGDDGVLHTVQGEAINLLLQPDRSLAHSGHQGMGGVHHPRQRLWVWHQLHQTQVVGRVHL